ncbi:unnamed protein product [Somion occarium]|uniref:HMG box domain-containing protein n=1 Tax=Somion occarium TaxID=3059160 RepID=A0ABP1DL94_9APHY
MGRKQSPGPPGPSNRVSLAGKAKKAKMQKAPRPPNAWIIFRSSRSKELRVQFGSQFSQAQLSKMISAQWKEISPEQLAYYESRAEDEKQKHRLMYPDYKYAPVSKAEKLRIREQEKQERQLAKAMKNEKPAAEISTPPPMMLGQQVPYHVAAQYGSMGPSPPYTSGSLPSSASTPSSSADASDHHVQQSSNASSSSLSLLSSPPSTSFPQFTFPSDDHSTPSTVVAAGSASTSRVPSSSTVIHHPSPIPSTSYHSPLQYDWSPQDEPFADPQVDMATDAFGGDHVSSDAPQTNLTFADEQFQFDNILSPPSVSQLALTLELPTFVAPSPWKSDLDSLQLGSLADQSFNQTVYTLPDLDVQNLEASNALQVDMDPAQGGFSLSEEDAASLAAYLQSLQAPPDTSNNVGSFDDFTQDQQMSMGGSMDMFSFAPMQNDNPYMQYDPMQYYQPLMEEPQMPQMPQQVDPSLLMGGPGLSSMQQYSYSMADMSSSSSSASSSYTPPPGASRVGARRVAGSWRPPPQFMVPTPPAGTPQYLSPMPSASWNGVPTN